MIKSKKAKNEIEELRVKELLMQYRNLLNELHETGVVRTSKVVSDYGEYVVCKLLNLSRSDSKVQKGFDAVGSDGLKYEIKARKETSWHIPRLFRVTKKQLETSDYIIYIEFDDFWEVKKLLKLPSGDLIPNPYKQVHITKERIEKYSIPF